MKDYRKKEIRKEADAVREKCRTGRYGTVDLFRESEHLGYRLIRYPLGENADLGFCTRRDQDIIIFTNSGSRLSREIFTLAHEIGHAVLHVGPTISFIDNQETIAGKTADEREAEANYFAACLLTPEEMIDKFLSSEVEYEKAGRLSAIDIARMMSVFQVSFETALYRLSNLGKITPSEKERLENEKTKSRVGNLLRAVGNSGCLNEPEKTIYFPYEYLADVIYNYNHQAIPEETLEKALRIYGLTKDDISDKLISKVMDETDDLDQLIKGIGK